MWNSFYVIRYHTYISYDIKNQEHWNTWNISLMIKNYFSVYSIPYINCFFCQNIWNIDVDENKTQQKYAKISNIKKEFWCFEKKNEDGCERDEVNKM